MEKLEHRAGKDASGQVGDGVGLMIQVPHKLMVKAAKSTGIENLGAERDYGVDMEKTVSTEPEHYQTNVEKVFTAGDMHRGQSLVVWVIAEGRAAAAEVDEYMMGYTSLK